MDNMTLNQAAVELGPEQFCPVPTEIEGTSALSRLADFGRSAFESTVSKLAAPLDSLPVVNKKWAILSSAGAFAAAGAVNAEATSAHPADGKVPPVVRKYDQASTLKQSTEIATTASVKSRYKYYQPGDRSMVRELKREIKARNCDVDSSMMSDPYGSKDNPTGKTPRIKRKYGHASFNFLDDGDKQEILIVPRPAYKVCVMQATTLGYETYFPQPSDLVKTKTGYKLKDRIRLSDPSDRAIRALGILFAHK